MAADPAEVNSNSNTLASTAPWHALVRLASIGDQLVGTDDRAAPALIREVESVTGLTASVWLRDEVGRPYCAGANHDARTVSAIHAELELRLETPRTEASLLGAPQDALLPGDARRVVVMLALRIRQRLAGVLAVSVGDGSEPVDEARLAFARAAADATSVALGHGRMIRDTAAALEDSRRSAEILDSISDAVVTCDADGRIVNWNTGAEQIYRYSRGEALGCDHATLLGTRAYSSDAEPVEFTEIAAWLHTGGDWRGELRQRSGDGRALTLQASVTARLDDRGRLDGFVIVSRDVTDQHRPAPQAHHDPLTGLPNRRWFTGDLYDALARSARSHTPMAVFIVDVHSVDGDDLEGSNRSATLKVLAERLTGMLRSTDRISRLGGSSLAIIAERAGGHDNAAHLARRLTTATETPLDLHGASVAVQASVSLCFTDGTHTADTTPEQLLAQARIPTTL